MSAMLDVVRGHPVLGQFSPAGQAVLATAWAEGRPLRPATSITDLETLVVAEHLCRREGMKAGAALESALSRSMSIADLRGIVRYTRARHEHDQLALAERSLDLYEFTREQLVHAADDLFRISADPLVEITVEDVLRALPGSYFVDEARELEPAHDDGPRFGDVVGSCARCGAVMRSRQSLAVFYDKVKTPQWRVVVVDDDFTPAEQRRVTSQALLDGAPGLCWSCTVRMRVKLIVWKDGAFVHVTHGDVTPIDVGDAADDVVAPATVVDPDVEHGKDALTFEEFMGW